LSPSDHPSRVLAFCCSIGIERLVDIDDALVIKKDIPQGQDMAWKPARKIIQLRQAIISVWQTQTQAFCYHIKKTRLEAEKGSRKVTSCMHEHEGHNILRSQDTLR
jgi:molybdenum cofactor biosynthesis enzyme MoaA